MGWLLLIGVRSLAIKKTHHNQQSHDNQQNSYPDKFTVKNNEKLMRILHNNKTIVCF